MTGENKRHGKITVRSAIIVLLILVGLLQFSLWADRKSIEVQGPSRLVRGPHDTIYVQVDRRIAKVSSEGDLLHVLDLDTDASIPEHIADFFVEEDGRLLIARRDSQLLQYYSPDGKLLSTHLRPPSPIVEDNHCCTLTKDSSTGILYFADASHHRIQMFGPDEKEIKTVTVPSGAPASSLINDEDLDPERVFSPDTPLQYPNGLTFAGDRLIATDTGNSRIILFYPDGTLDKIIPVFQWESSNYNNPVKVGRFGDTIYVIVRGRSFIGGKVQSYEFNTGLPKNFRYSRSIDPWDIFARPDDILVADRASLTVLRYGSSGRFLGTFGKPGLQSLYADSEFTRKSYEWFRNGSLASMVVVLGWLLFTSRRQRIAQDQAGISRYRPITALQNVLGPLSSARRKMLLILIPGLGQAAAGRLVRAGTLLIVLLYFASLLIYSWWQYQYHAGTSLPVLIATALMAYTVWVSIVLDGVRLTGKPSDNGLQPVAKRYRQAVFAPLITACAATAAQLAREFIMHRNPGVSPGIQKFFYFLITASNGYSPPFGAVLPASIIFGWGGAAAGIFGTLAWQARAGRNKILIGTAVGFLAGIFSWLITVLLAGNRLGVPPVQPIQGGLLGLFTYLYFRGMGMPMLIIPVAVAGAWVGDFLKLFFGILVIPVGKILSAGDAGMLWTGAIARLELILIPAFFIHLAIWMAWDIASVRPEGNVEG